MRCLGRTHSRLVAGIAAAALPLALLAGCSEAEPTPKFEDPTSEPSASESATPDEPVKPTPPAAMKGDDVQAAKAFVKYYFATMDYAIRTGDTKLLEQATPSCGSCAGVVNILESTRKNDGDITGGFHDLRQVDLDELPTQQGVHTFRGNMTIHTTSQVIRGSGFGDVDGKYPSGTKAYSILISRDSQSWAVADWQPL